jgi:hypothetical protein
MHGLQEAAAARQTSAEVLDAVTAKLRRPDLNTQMCVEARVYVGGAGMLHSQRLLRTLHLCMAHIRLLLAYRQEGCIR